MNTPQQERARTLKTSQAEGLNPKTSQWQTTKREHTEQGSIG